MIKRLKPIVLLSVIATTFLIYLFLNPQIKTTDTIITHATNTEKNTEQLSIQTIKPVIEPVDNNASSQTSFIKSKQNSKQENNYIVECPDMFSSTMEDEWSAKDKQLGTFLASLANSQNSEEQIAYVLYKSFDNKTEQLKQLFITNQLYPQSPLILQQLLDLCLQNPKFNQCNDALFEKIKLVDDQNAALWAKLAISKANKGDIDGATLALLEASKRGSYSEYFVDTINLFYNVQKQSGVFNHQSSLISAIGIGAAKPMFFKEVIDLCKNHSLNNLTLADACLQFGQLMADSGKEIISQAIGLALQKLIYQQTNNVAQLAKITTKLNQINDNAANYFQDIKVSNVMMYDEKLANLWLKTGLAKGEFISMVVATKEAIELSKNKYYQPCKLTR